MALVRKTNKLEEEITNKLNSLQRKSGNKRISNLGVPGAELAYRIAGAPDVFYTRKQRELLNDLSELPGEFVRTDMDIEVAFMDPAPQQFKTNAETMGMGVKHSYYGQHPFVTDKPNTAAQARSKTLAGSPKIVLPLRFKNEFNFYSGQVYFRLVENMHTNHRCHVYIVSSDQATELQSKPSNVYKRLRHDDSDKITNLIESLSCDYNEFETEYMQTHKTREYIFKTLWPSIRSLNAAVKHFPGITEYIGEETKERLYRRTERNVTPGEDHLAPPQEVMVATAKHKLLGGENDN